MGRRDLRPAVEAICRELEGPVHLRELARRAAEAAGVAQRPGTLATVREAVGRLPFMVAAGQGMWVPARVVLAGKAFRLSPPRQGWVGGIPRWRMEPFASALEDPLVVDADGRSLDPVAEDKERFGQRLDEELRESARELVEFVVRDDALRRSADQGGPDALVGQLLAYIGSGSTSLGQLLATAMTPYRLPEGAPEHAELIVRYDRDGHALRVGWERPEERDEERIREADRRFCDFVAGRLREGWGAPVRRLFLEAYACIQGFGEYPGSAPEVALAADRRFRLVGEPEEVGRGYVVARADDIAFLAQFEQRRAAVEWMRHEMAAALGRGDPVRRGDEETDSPRVLSGRKRALRRDLELRIRRHHGALSQDRKALEAKLGLQESGGRLGVGAYVTARAQGLSNEELLARWEEHLKRRAMGEASRRRKVDHLRVLGEYLASGREGAPIGLAEAAGPELESFFFWAYPRRYPASVSDAQAFTRDVWEFYRWMEQEGLLADSRFAELVYRLRHHLAERIRLYAALDPEQPGWERLYEMLFLGPSGT